MFKALCLICSVFDIFWLSDQLYLSELLCLSAQVPMERRNNRATMATFKMTTGAIACLSHTLLLHGSDFFSAMDITGDGYHIIIHDPYQNPSLQVRRPFTNHYEQVSPAFKVQSKTTGPTWPVKCRLHQCRDHQVVKAICCM